MRSSRSFYSPRRWRRRGPNARRPEACEQETAQLRRSALAEALDRLAHEAQADHAAAPVDRGDRVRRDEPAAAQETGPDGERVGHVRGGAVHRRLDPPDDAAASVGDQIAGGRAQVESCGTHQGNRMPRVRGKNTGSVRVLLTARAAISTGSTPARRLLRNAL